MGLGVITRAGIAGGVLGLGVVKVLRSVDGPGLAGVGRKDGGFLGDGGSGVRRLMDAIDLSRRRSTFSVSTSS